MSTVEWRGTAEYVDVDGQVNLISDYDPAAQAHLWLVAVAYLVQPRLWAQQQQDPPLLDQENLVLLRGPNCYHCDQAWTAELDDEPCPGEPP